MSALTTNNVRVILICGYRRHGKDTLFKVISGEDTTSSFDEYYLKDRQDHEAVFGPSTSKYVRVSFADLLKKDVAEVMGISLEFLEENKDRPLRQEHKHLYTFDHLNPEIKDIPTYRDVMINHSIRCKSVDMAYYPRHAFDPYLSSLDCDHNDDGTILVVTDWRFVIEYEYACKVFGTDNVSTVRVFNPNVGIPYYDVESEHQLDNHETQVICRPKRRDNSII